MAEKKVTKQTLDRDELLKFLPMNNSALDEFTPSLDVPKKYLPSFKLKQLDVGGKRLMNSIKARIQRDATLLYSDPNRADTLDSMLSENDELLELTRKYVVGWDNFKDVDGNSFVFEKDSKGDLSIECFKNVSAIFQAEIVARLMLISGLSSKEELGLKS